MRALSIRVHGLVQGVYFRASTQEKALELNITGWCRNEKDRSVLIRAEGAAGMLEALVVWCHQGPLMAKVQEVKVEEVPLEGFTDFEIRR